MRLIYAAEAVADLVRLRNFIAEKDPNAAARTAANLIARMDNLCRFPLMGRNIDRAPDSGTLREMVFGHYVVRYSIHADAVAILRIWHHLPSAYKHGHAYTPPRRCTMETPLVSSHPEVMSGALCFVGTRLFDYLEGSSTLEDFLADFPSVSRARAVAALEAARPGLAIRSS